MISSMLVFARNCLGHSCAKRREVPRSQVPSGVFFGGSGKCFLRSLHKRFSGNRNPEGARHSERSRDAPCRRAREQHRASDRGRAGEKLEEWRSYRNLRRLGRLLKMHFRKPPTIKFSVSPPSKATSNQRVQCTHTKPHSLCSPSSNRARHGRPRRRYTAAPIRCRHGKRLRNAPYGNVADHARHRWHGWTSFRCTTIWWTAAMRSPIQRMTGTAIELTSAL